MAVGAELAEVAGAKPPVLEAGCGPVVVVQVSRGDHVPADEDLAAFVQPALTPRGRPISARRAPRPGGCRRLATSLMP